MSPSAQAPQGNMTKFLNRLLGAHVEMQSKIFSLFCSLLVRGCLCQVLITKCRLIASCVQLTLSQGDRGCLCSLQDVGKYVWPESLHRTTGARGLACQAGWRIR